MYANYLVCVYCCMLGFYSRAKEYNKVLFSEALLVYFLVISKPVVRKLRNEMYSAVTGRQDTLRHS